MIKNKYLFLFSGLFFLFPLLFPQSEINNPENRSKIQAKINGCQLFPSNNIWNTPIDKLPADTNSNLYINTIGASATVHADFGSGTWDGGPIGIPYTTVPGTQSKVNITFDYDDESDPGPYPVPPNAPIEGGSDSDGDRHVLVLDRDNCILYELYDAWPQPDGSWHAGSGAIFDLKSNALRPAGWTSADAAGLPILPGLVRYDEVASGEINHALRFTAPQTRRKYIWPARHYASSLTGSQYPPMGQRFRLKANFNISGFSPQVQVILKALKKYGMILADNGSSWYISGVPDERWNNDDLHDLGNVRGSDFEAVDESSLMISPNSGAALQSTSTSTITVTTPNGGEHWTVGTSQTITWSSSGTVGNVKIDYSTNNGSSWTTVVSSTANDGSYKWTVPDAPSSHCLVRIRETDGTPSDTSNSVFSIVADAGAPEIFLNRTLLNAGAVTGMSTGPQTVYISNSGTGTLNWKVSDDADWLFFSPSSGTNSGVITVSTRTAGLDAGPYTGTISISDPNAVNSPQTVTVHLTVKNSSQDQPPIGSFDSPINGATVRSSIPVTGWALDDVEVEGVKIYRQLAGQRIFIGSAVFVEGARPDVETSYTDYPYNYKAGWGYMMLTNFLPNNGNGTYTLTAAAVDVSGNEVILGTSTITCDNANAVKPFGAIDTPDQGGKATGSQFINWGWVLTPQPNHIATNGSTIKVYVDGVYLGHPVYNIFRRDIADLFPGYNNSSGAAGYFYLDTTTYANGVHTIQWIATDNKGNTDGIGSRYFTIQNPGSSNSLSTSAQSSVSPDLEFPTWQYKNLGSSYSHVELIKGYNTHIADTNISAQLIYPDEDNNITIEIKELERIEIHFSEEPFEPASPVIDNEQPFIVRNGFQVIGDRFAGLPIGSTLDREKGIYFWQPGPGFSGEYKFLFIVKEKNGILSKMNIIIKITP